MVAVILQPACLQHRYIRKRDTSTIVERPERLRAVLVGIAASLAKLEHDHSTPSKRMSLAPQAQPPLEDDLVNSLRQLDITTNGGTPNAIDIRTTQRTVDLSSNPAVRFVHGESSDYINKLKLWASTSEDNILHAGSEIPAELPQGDLYLCPQSIQAMSGAVAAVFEGIDLILESSASTSSEPPLVPSVNSNLLREGDGVQPINQTKRCFVGIRPPGHHCSDDTPSGFCFINNVLIAAAHAHLHHGIRRVIVLDIDLHHGNGTQSIAWSINAETQRQDLESAARVEAGQSPLNPGLKVFYGSLHDVLSFPCEDGDPTLVQAASTSVNGAHGQYIQNVHLEPYESESDFYDRLYPKYRDKLLSNALEFIRKTGGITRDSEASDVLVLISAGFDASPHEHSYMSRHGRNVPTTFYKQFALDVRDFADQYADGRILSVLEGGYSNRALISGVGSLMEGLGGENRDLSDWWDVIRLEKLEKLTKPVARGTRPRLSNMSVAADEQAWYSRTISLLGSFDPAFLAPLPPLPKLRGREAPPSLPKMTLRERRKPGGEGEDVVEATTPVPIAEAQGPIMIRIKVPPKP